VTDDIREVAKRIRAQDETAEAARAQEAAAKAERAAQTQQAAVDDWTARVRAAERGGNRERVQQLLADGPPKISPDQPSASLRRERAIDEAADAEGHRFGRQWALTQARASDLRRIAAEPGTGDFSRQAAADHLRQCIFESVPAGYGSTAASSAFWMAGFRRSVIEVYQAARTAAVASTGKAGV
jgi:hypothetical protein